MSEYDSASVYVDTRGNGITITLHQGGTSYPRGELWLSFDNARHLATMILAMLNDEAAL